MYKPFDISNEIRKSEMNGPLYYVIPLNQSLYQRNTKLNRLLTCILLHVTLRP